MKTITRPKVCAVIAAANRSPRMNLADGMSKKDLLDKNIKALGIGFEYRENNI
ncbi:MAG: hypothetical protein FWD71_13535 [Oscillospiraceae bacterium]|nr:hypothetical protein [Oscillospiraceae bacterium]